MIVNNENTCTNLIGNKKIIDYFTEKLAEESTDSAPNTCISTEPISGSLKLYDENLTNKYPASKIVSKEKNILRRS